MSHRKIKFDSPDGEDIQRTWNHFLLAAAANRFDEEKL